MRILSVIQATTKVVKISKLGVEKVDVSDSQSIVYVSLFDVWPPHQWNKYWNIFKYSVFWGGFCFLVICDRWIKVDTLS